MDGLLIHLRNFRKCYLRRKHFPMHYLP
ncbi:Protein of unknown function [Pyronema omphalodes CBS 100304]|uniref:Uncharacterized protein n=1 Tax=Pyronema omphalodes (strain CBS 100304) TaxID=1076935 RepID=U4L8N8_PYROM|nr:Protein of unknown function [Pyronema omphalodes CBS 100304]